MFTTELLIGALSLNALAIVGVGVALRRALRRYRARTADLPVRATAAATAVVDLSSEPTMRIPMPLYAATDPWEGTPIPPAWEAYVCPAEAAARPVAAVEPGTGRRVIVPRRNAAPAAAEPPAAPTAVIPVSPPDGGGRWIELILTPMTKK